MCFISTLFIILLSTILISLIIFSCSNKEGFTAPGLTLINPPSWFPQNSSKAYKKEDWQNKMYLDMYKGKKGNNEYESVEETEQKAKVFRFWRN